MNNAIKMRKILLVGDGNHQFLTSYSIWLKNTDQNLIVDILSYKVVNKEHCYSKIYPVKVPFLLKKIPKISNLVFYIIFFYIYKRLHKSYDIIHFHMAFPGIRYVISMQNRAKKILSFWGSDFYHANKHRKRQLRFIIGKMDLLTCTNPQMAVDIANEYKLDKEINVISYGLQPLEELSKISQDKVEIKQKLNIQTNKTIVTIGYNNNFNQNHLQIIRQLNTISQIQNRVFVIVPLTYGRAGIEHINKIRELLQKNNFEFKLMTEYLSDFEVAQLRKVTDIFIQLQASDQLSGSMQEHMYAKNIVITGSWLPYNIFREKGIYFHTIDKINDLPEKVQYCLENIDNEFLKMHEHPNIIYQMSGWENVISKWVLQYQ